MQNKKTSLSLRHGDWTFIPFAGKITGEKIPMEKNKFTFAVGEATNHYHTLHVSKINDMEWYKQENGSYLVIIKEKAFATHPEHSTKTDLEIPIGTYLLRQRREKDWFSGAVRKVID